MTDDAPTMAVGGFARKLWSEADRLALMAEFGHWDGTQADFREARGVPAGTFRSWRQRYGPAAAATAGRPGGFAGIAAGAGPGWDAGLSPRDGVTLRVRRS